MGIAPKLELRKKNLLSCVYFYLLQTTSHKKISLRGRAGTAEINVPTSVLHMPNLLFIFLSTFYFLKLLSLPSSSSLLCVNCWESERVFSRMNACEVLDCEQSLFFLRLSEGSARERERRAAKRL